MNNDLVLVTLGTFSLICALIPAVLFVFNLRRYRPAPFPSRGASLPAVSVLIPARDEEDGIEATVLSVLANKGIEFEVILLDDHSRDATARIVADIAAIDSRVRLVPAPPLPEGWSGKQHACWQLAWLARHPLLLFLDADVRLTPDALARSAAILLSSGADLVSGIPRQEAVGLLEKLVIPLIHFILLGFLPIGRMRRTTAPSYAAGCGQLFVTRKNSYLKAGGHAEIRSTFHDGIKLPRAYRAAGLMTDLFDPTDIATCRMYRSPAAVWNGLAKNAEEGLATPRLIVPISVILIAGQVAPIVLLLYVVGFSPLNDQTWILQIIGLAIAASYYPRLAMLDGFHQSRLGALLHPMGIVVLLTIQWYSVLQRLVGKRVTWKGRPAPLKSRESEEFIQSLFYADIESTNGSERTIENSA